MVAGDRGGDSWRREGGTGGEEKRVRDGWKDHEHECWGERNQQ